jgi:hypothetical protein
MQLQQAEQAYIDLSKRLQDMKEGSIQTKSAEG